MACNGFVDKMLAKLALVNPRLRCPLTRLHIQIEMQYPIVRSIIQYFLMLQAEYRYHWNLYPTTNAISGYNLIQIQAFIQLRDHMTGQKLLTFDEADWLEDAIHETLIGDD
jgi:hypothetical protein